MRINLKCPYAEKDQAKALGARWDPALKTWYIQDIEDITDFMRWIPSGGGQPSQSTMPAPKSKADQHAPARTASPMLPHCGCTHVAPWEHCEHTLMH